MSTHIFRHILRHAGGHDRADVSLEKLSTPRSHEERDVWTRTRPDCTVTIWHRKLFKYQFLVATLGTLVAVISTTHVRARALKLRRAENDVCVTQVDGRDPPDDAIDQVVVRVCGHIPGADKISPRAGFCIWMFVV